MELIDKAQIIVDFTANYSGEPAFADFFEYNDLGVPISIAITGNLINLTDDGIELFNETWNNICELFKADPNEEYEDIEDLIG